MIVPISIIYFLVSVVALAFGFRFKSLSTLFALSIFWWVGAFASAYFTYLAWIDRSYSENWAMIDFIFLALPYAAHTIALIFTELYFMRKWSGRQVKFLQLNLLTLLTFLVLQIVLGLFSA